MLKASYEVLQPAAGHSFLIKNFGERAFTAPYHFHPEYELTLITEGRGKRYVGNHMADFNTGDLVLIGPHLPHCWKLEATGKDWPPAGKDSRPAEKPRPASAIVIQFAPDFLGKEFFSKAELTPIHNLLQNSGCGIQFLRPAITPNPDERGQRTAAAQRTTTPAVEERIRSLAAGTNDFRKLIGLLEILQELALSRNSVLLDTRRITAELPPMDRERIHPIFAHLVENFRGEVSLAAAAAVIGMTPNAFCRYFKKITRKTYMETVIEYRLNYATQQLVQTGKPISAICFDSGFSDISHFYKMFRSRMQVSPLHYRKKFMQETTGN
jgi:AraC-like DNA-binding protein